MLGKSAAELKPGDWAESSKTLAESDIYLFAGLVGDFNPAHVNQVYAEKTHFKGRIAHGFLVAGLLSGVLSSKLPGPGGIHIGHELTFRAPAYIGDTITARVEVASVDVAKNRVLFKVSCRNQDGKVLVEGTVRNSPPIKK